MTVILGVYGRQILDSRGNPTIEVEVVSPKPATIFSADGRVVTELATGDHLKIRRGRPTVRLMHLAGSSFCETLRRKLHWRGATL